MKFRELKKHDFVIYSDLEECYWVNKNGILTEHIKWEYDNGLYINTGIDKQAGKWKELKHAIKEAKNDKYSYISVWINTGYCHRCGKKLTENNFNFDTEYIECDFENDYFYCNNCKEKEIADFEKFMLDYDNEDGAEEYQKYYSGQSKICPVCGGKIKHPYIGNVTSEQIDEDINTCLWGEVIDESRSTIGYTPICKKEYREK